MSPPPRRVLPPTEGPTGFFWTMGEDGQLRFLQCDACGYRIHPPTSYCPECGGREAVPRPVSGCATLYSFTVNHQPWDGDDRPYVIGVVELVEQAGLRLMTNIVGASPDEVYIGMPLEVTFDDLDPVHLPFFRPRST
ncbi:putative nucleic-acid-binding protein containing a Zn-ribbon [Mycolicibacterium chubuense NBB4]|uniref:Putative nucleic-acid-binding protein containing a Zn-ribbon n=1 Tax=Mycolicibacterium chubuense (strain NBB4) TaxID=710421 RepID=I4BKA3_MYCCN|nr:OB-fold domain-containing protein [Mycolicibacterium chubuense]AFM17710.1 putative nucleic-acid-binding protein containing a Zn-ribbon [Mycolicibacterium chubuense NBB4]